MHCYYLLAALGRISEQKAILQLQKSFYRLIKNAYHHGTNTNFNTWPRGYKTYFTLNSVEHEILNAHKDKKIKKFGILGSDKLAIFPAYTC